MSKIVNKLDLTKDVADYLVDIPQATVKKIIDATLDVIKHKLIKGEQVSIAGFGIFDVAERAARMGRNPKTGEQIKIEASRNPRFKASKLLKKEVQQTEA